MKFLRLLGLLAVLAHMLAPSTAGRICPNRCHSNRQLAVSDCENYNDQIYAMCEVKPCPGGFSCTLPENSFLIPYDQLSQFEAVIEYTWSAEHRDLDTSTRWMGVDDTNVGFSCSNNSPFLRFSGDSSSYGGTEVVVLDIMLAARDQFDDSVAIEAYAGWHGSENHGAAQMSLYLRRKSNGVLVTGTILTTPISPGYQNGCASTHVATITYFHGTEHSRFTLQRV